MLPFRCPSISLPLSFRFAGETTLETEMNHKGALYGISLVVRLICRSAGGMTSYLVGLLSMVKGLTGIGGMTYPSCTGCPRIVILARNAQAQLGSFKCPETAPGPRRPFRVSFPSVPLPFSFRSEWAPVLEPSGVWATRPGYPKAEPPTPHRRTLTMRPGYLRQDPWPCTMTAPRTLRVDATALSILKSSTSTARKPETHLQEHTKSSWTPSQQKHAWELINKNNHNECPHKHKLTCAFRVIPSVI